MGPLLLSCSVLVILVILVVLTFSLNKRAQLFHQGPPLLNHLSPCPNRVSRTASTLNSRVNFRLSMTHLRLHQNT